MPSLIIGVIVAILSGALMGLLHAVLSITFKVDQIIGGTVINLLATGVSGFLNRQLFFEKGSIFGGHVPHAPGVLPRISIPLLSNIPVVGQIFEQQPIAITAILLVILAHFILFRTRWGLRTRAVGEHPRAADTVGINVFRMRYMNVIIGGAIAGLAGAYFTLESVPSFEPNMTNGRGFYRAGSHDLWQLVALRRLGCGAAVWRCPGVADQLAVLPQYDPAPVGFSATSLCRRHGALYPDHADPDRHHR